VQLLTAHLLRHLVAIDSIQRELLLLNLLEVLLRMFQSSRELFSMDGWSGERRRTSGLVHFRISHPLTPRDLSPDRFPFLVIGL